MALAQKAGTIIRVGSNGNAGHTDFEDQMTAYYTVEVSGMGAIQDGEKERSVPFATLTTDTRAGIMVKAKTAVDAEIAAG